jgi:hypothetical protein
MAKKRLFDENGNEVKGKLKKPIYKRIWFWVLAVAIVGSFANGGDDEAETTTAADTQTQTTTIETETTAASSESAVPVEPAVEPAPVEPSFTIGQVVNVGDVEYTVNSISTATTLGSEYFNQTANGVYLVVEVRVKNNGQKAMMVDTNLFSLVDGEIVYDSDGSASTYANTDESGTNLGFFLENLNPGLEKTGKVVFDVPQSIIDGATKQLKVTTGFFGTQSALINLQ